MVKEPGNVVRGVETRATLPTDGAERFAGYGIMGLPFASGHVLAVRHFPTSSLGPGYTSVWHRDPRGNWVFYADVAPHHSCSRYFDAAVARSERGAISLTWHGPRELEIAVPRAGLVWAVRLAETPVTRLVNRLAAAMPLPLWRRVATTPLVAQIAARALGAGRLRLRGRTPNGWRFQAVPSAVWVIEASRAWIGDTDLGPPGSVSPQARLGDFLIPRRGLFVAGSAWFEASAVSCLATAGGAA
jgi:hypothetical protein